MGDNTKKTVYIFIDECLVVGGLLRYLTNNGHTEPKNELHKSFIESFEISNNIYKLIEELYNTPTKMVVTESCLIGAIEKIKNRKEYKEYSDEEKINKLLGYIQKRRRKHYNNTAEYHLKFDEINTYVIRESKEKEYKDLFNKTYGEILKTFETYRILDCSDINLFKVLLAYSIRRNGKGIYILLTVDRRIVKRFSNVFNLFFKRKIWVSEPKILYDRILYHSNKGKIVHNVLDLFHHSTAEYIISSIQNNSKK